MAVQLSSLRLLTILAVGVLAEPIPGRIPKVYNALITSNQNLEPSKAYPVYQPVLHETFGFPFQPAVFYGGDFPLHNGLFHGPALAPKDSQPKPSEATPTATPEAPSESPNEQIPSSTAAPQPAETEPSSPAPADETKSSPALPPPRSTQSPIPLNEFGLPPQIVPIGNLNPAFGGFSHVGHYPYPYPGLRFYDPFDAFSINPYANFPLYRPFTNLLGPNLPLIPNKEVETSEPGQSTEKTASQTPPPEPSDLNVLNYSSKDPTIPDVPPPPLPQGGLKTDKTE